MRLIEKTEDLKEFCAQKFPDFITIDTEFLRDKTYYPQLCLIQIGGPDIEAVAIDPLAKDMDLKPLHALLKNKKVLKVFHAASQDLEIFYQVLNGKMPEPIFDSQIAASVLGYGEQIAYNALVKRICKEDIDKSRQFTDWAHRPLGNAQLSYAIGDVTYLVKIYQHLEAELKKRKRLEWIAEDMESLRNPKNYDHDPMEAWKKIRIRSRKIEDYAALQALAAWREKEAQKKDTPKQRILKDDVLMQLAMLRPKAPENLKRVRGLPEGYKHGDQAANLLKIIENSQTQIEKSTITLPKNNNRNNKDVTPIVDMLKLLLKINAGEQGIVGRMIASADDLERFALGDLEDLPMTRGWRYEIFGKDAEKLSKGKLSLSLKDGKVQKL